jgi:V-type H+-transporting ATPase subunit a
VLAEVDRPRFERALFRATRGNCYVRFAPIDSPITDPTSGLLVDKSVFLIFYKSSSIGGKITRICDAFGGRRYQVPDVDGGAAAFAQAMQVSSESHLSRPAPSPRVPPPPTCV